MGISGRRYGLGIHHHQNRAAPRTQEEFTRLGGIRKRATLTRCRVDHIGGFHRGKQMELNSQEKIHAECLRRAKRILDPIALGRNAESPKRLAERLARAHKAIVEFIEESDTSGDADHIMWSAICAVLFDDPADNVHPYSVGGQRLMSLCNANVSASAMFKAADQRVDQIAAMKSMEWSRLCIEKHRAFIEECRTELGRSKGSKRSRIEKKIAYRKSQRRRNGVRWTAGLERNG